jgi:hypothetical protein
VDLNRISNAVGTNQDRSWIMDREKTRIRTRVKQEKEA